MTEEHRFCGECKRFYQAMCNVEPHDRACPLFVPKKGVSKEVLKKYVLELYAEVPQTIKPCGFYGNLLTESCWLPYKDQQGNVELRPSVIRVEKDKQYEIIDFLSKKHEIKGVFPSQDMQSLMSVKGVQMLMSNTDIEPQKVDQQIDEAFKKHLEMAEAERILTKRWIQGTHFYDVFDAYPLQNILGVSESGKSRLNLLNLALCYHAEGVIDPTEASIFRAKEEDRATLCIDEAEYLNNPQLHATLRILINASYSKYSGFVTRYDEINGKRVKRRFDLYSPMSIVGIGGLEGVTLSRAFRIVMRRVEKDFPKANPDTYRELRDMLYVLRIRHCFDVHELYQKTDISDFVSARFEELFKPLFCMTTFFGNKEEYEILKEWCSEYQASFRVEALNVAEEEMCLISLANMNPYSEYQQDWFSLRELTEKINMQYSRNVSPKYVSSVLYRLGLIKRKKVHGLTLVYATKEMLEEVAKRIGVTLAESELTKWENVFIKN